MTLVAGLFGYAKWKYQHRLNEYARLASDGVRADLLPAKANWWEFIATGRLKIERAYSARILVGHAAGDTYRIGKQQLSLNELEATVAGLKQRIERLGIRARVSYDFRHGSKQQQKEVARRMRKLDIGFGWERSDWVK
jgi:hypothetical protein